MKGKGSKSVSEWMGGSEASVAPDRQSAVSPVRNRQTTRPLRAADYESATQQFANLRYRLEPRNPKPGTGLWAYPTGSDL